MMPLVTSDTEKMATDEELEGRQSRSVLLVLLFENDTDVHKVVSHGVSHGGFIRAGDSHWGYKLQV
jgi:hypothetical protein